MQEMHDMTESILNNVYQRFKIF